MDLFNLKAKISLDDKDFTSGIDKAESKTDGISKSIGGIASSIGGFALKAGAVVGTVVGTLGTIGVKYNSTMEQYQTSFKTMLGSAEKAQKFVKNLKEFAAKTPFEMKGLAEASKTLLAFGIKADKVQPTLKMLGDISQGNEEKFKSLALVFGQVSSQGKLMGGDLLQIKEQEFYCRAA